MSAPTRPSTKDTMSDNDTTTTDRIHLHQDDCPDTLSALRALTAGKRDLPGIEHTPTGAWVCWDDLATSYLSTSETAIVHILRGCSILERHGGGAPASVAWSVEVAVAKAVAR